MKHTSLQARRSLLTLALMGAFAAPGAYAAMLTVDPAAADGVAADGKCSLREAVIQINAGADSLDCVNSSANLYGATDTITMPAGTYNLTVTGLDESWAPSMGAFPYVVVNTPDAAIGDIDIMKSVRIVGAGADSTIIQWDAGVLAANRDRIFHVYTTAAVTVNVAIEGVTITGGRTNQEFIASGADDPLTPGGMPTEYYLRRAGGSLAVGPAANVVLKDPDLTGAANSAGRGGSLKPGESDPGGATFTLTLSGVKVLANQAQGDGAGIYTASPMTATNVVVSTNISTTNGGGIYNEGNTSIANSTLSGNKAEGGGGVFLTGSNTVSFSGVTLSGNRAIGGGALSSRSGVTTSMVNSTISGNLGDDVGAGFYSNGPGVLRFVTIANNVSGADSGSAGSGINVFPSGAVAVTLKNVLLAANKKGWDPVAEPTGPSNPAALTSANCGYTGSSMAITSLGNNLSSDASCTTLIHATDKASVDPKIDVLADNTGPTLTHKLLAGSPALGAGAAIAGVTLDQRGVTRDATPDLGAYEEPTIVIPPTTPPTTGTTGGGGGGGCTVNPDAGFDPGLLALLATAIGGVLLRRRRQQAARR
ncbi:MAG: right-handed parallel beta-helix repeat-containing protein [Rhodoferax sp.]|nr:right-handed parallel beta-helix repeat-containing protein [Rhodoferax sp.]